MMGSRPSREDGKTVYRAMQDRLVSVVKSTGEVGEMLLMKPECHETGG